MFNILIFIILQSVIYHSHIYIYIMLGTPPLGHRLLRFAVDPTRKGHHHFTPLGARVPKELPETLMREVSGWPLSGYPDPHLLYQRHQSWKFYAGNHQFVSYGGNRGSSLRPGRLTKLSHQMHRRVITYSVSCMVGTSRPPAYKNFNTQIPPNKLVSDLRRAFKPCRAIGTVNRLRHLRPLNCVLKLLLKYQRSTHAHGLVA